MSLSSQLRLLPRSFWILVGATFVNRFGVFIVPFLALFITQNGNTTAQAGCAVAACSLGGFFAAWIGGWMADRFGRNVTMAMTSVASAICMISLSQAVGWRMLALLGFLTGAMTEAGQPAAAALAQDMVPPEHRVTAFAVKRFAVNLAWCAGGTASPALGMMLFDRDSATLWTVNALLGLVAAVLILAGRRARPAWAGPWPASWPRSADFPCALTGTGLPAFVSALSCAPACSFSPPRSSRLRWILSAMCSLFSNSTAMRVTARTSRRRPSASIISPRR